MNPFRQIALSLLVAVAAVSAPARAADPSGEEIVKRSQEAFYYAGRDMRSKVRMKLINAQGNVR